MIASFVGWGIWTKRWIAPGRLIDVGLLAGWGLAAYVLVGGLICGAHLAVRPVLIGQVAVGIFGLGWIEGIRRPSWARLRRRSLLATAHPGTYLLLAAGCGLTLLTFFGYLGWHWFNPSDDLPFYFTLAKKLEQTGSLYEPYAARRIATFGGQVYLHATFVSIASFYYLHGVDGGIATVLVFLLVIGQVAGSSHLSARHALPLGLALMLLFTLQEVRVNTNSEATGLVAILALYRSIRVPLGDGGEPSLFAPRRTILLACLTLTSVLLRISNAPAVLAFIVILHATEHFAATARPWSRPSLRSLGRTTALFAVTSIGAFLPWSVLQRQSSGTFFYPLGHSNVTPGWTLLLAPKGWPEELEQLIEHIFYSKPISLFLPFAVAGLVPLRGRARNDLVALSIGTLVGLGVFSHQAVAFGPSNTSRYLYATYAAVALLVMASVERTAASVGVAAVALAMHLATTRDEVRGMLKSLLQQAHTSLENDGAAEVAAFEGGDTAYRDLQEHTVAGATMVTAVNESFRFDFKRNRILALDVLGGMGPSPGWPAHKGPAALAKFLRDNGVRYLAWVDFNGGHEFYGRSHWTPFVGQKESYLGGEAVLQLDAEDSIEKLSTNETVVFKEGGMTLVDLGPR